MDVNKLESYIDSLKRFFDEIEYYDLNEKIKITAKNGKTTISNIENSKESSLILNNALKERKRLVEVDYLNGRVIETISNYYDNNGNNCVLKLRFDVGDSVVVEAKGEGNIVEEVMKHNLNMYKDPLTGVYNRSYFDSHMMGTDVNALSMIDVDDFKSVNDKYGHPKGDEVLAVIAQTIEKAAGDAGTTVRYGGDEFVVVFHEIEKKKFSSQLKNICKAVNGIKIDGMKEKLSISVGGVYGFENLKDMISKADKLMYQAKTIKNDFVYADSDKV